MALNIFTLLYGFYHHPSPEFFTFLNSNSVSIKHELLVPPSPAAPSCQPLGFYHELSDSINLTIWNTSYKWHQTVVVSQVFFKGPQWLQLSFRIVGPFFCLNVDLLLVLLNRTVRSTKKDGSAFESSEVILRKFPGIKSQNCLDVCKGFTPCPSSSWKAKWSNSDKGCKLFPYVETSSFLNSPRVIMTEVKICLLFLSPLVGFI